MYMFTKVNWMGNKNMDIRIMQNNGSALGFI